MIDKKLVGGRIGLTAQARHRNGPTLILQAILPFVLDTRSVVAFDHPWFKTASLNHELRDDPMENRAVVGLVLGVLHKVLN